LTKFTELS